LSHDDTSWRASGLKRKYEDYPEVAYNRNRKKANTKRWCKGKVGREHKLVLSRPQYFHDPYGCYDGLNLVPKKHDNKCSRFHNMKHTYRCANCGKYVDDMAEEVRAIVDPVVAKMRELENQWCQEGHLWDWIPDDGYYWSNYRYERRVCLMCGRKKSRTLRKVNAQ
jgi:hypothetical protein